MAFSDLMLNVAAKASIEAMKAEIAPLEDFVHDYTELDGRKGEAIAIPYINLSASGEFDADTNNYCDGSNVVDGLTLSLDKHLVQSAVITDRQIAATDFNWFGDLTKAMTTQLIRDANKTVFQMFTSTNVPLSATLDVSSKTAIASLVNTCAANDIPVADTVVVLGPADFYKVLGTLDANVYGGTEAVRGGRVPGLYGFKAFVQSTYLPDGVKGVIVSKDAVGLASRYLQPLEGAYVDAFRVSGAGIPTVGFRHFANLCTGRRYLAGECLFGAKILQADKCVRLV